MTTTQAANELQAIRNAIADGGDRGELVKRVDAVGYWLAGQKWSKMVAKLGREAHDISVKLVGFENLNGEWLVKSR